MVRTYRYVGPEAIRIRAAPPGTDIASAADLFAWVADGDIVALTFVIETAGCLRVADRRSEHVACAGGGDVLSAGELFLRRDGDAVEVVEASNQSTGYCPEPESWPAVAAALDRLGVAHPGRFTTAVTFRRCERCGQRNLVKDGWFICAVCGADLPAAWNFG